MRTDSNGWLAAYGLRTELAERAGDDDPALTARMIQKDEQAMAEGLASSFDPAMEESPRGLEDDDIGEQLNKYLADPHAIEQQAAKLLEKTPKLAGTDERAR